MTTTEICLRHAAKFAANSTLRVRVGAYFTRGGSDWYGARNQRKTHPGLARLGLPKWSTRHAEMALALESRHRGGSWEDSYCRLVGQDIYVARLLLDGSWALARPCKHCMKMLAGERVRSVTWTTEPGEWDSLTL